MGADGPAYESSSSKKLIHGIEQDNQIRDKEMVAIDHHDDGVPRIIMSRNGYVPDKSQEGLNAGPPNDQESMQGSIDA